MDVAHPEEIEAAARPGSLEPLHREFLIADFHPVNVFRIWLQVGNLGLVFVVSDIGTTEGNRLVLLGVGNDGVHFRRVGRLGAEEQAGRAVGVPDEPRLGRSVLARTAREHIDSSAIGELRKHSRCRQQPAGDSRSDVWPGHFHEHIITKITAPRATGFNQFL